MHGTTLSIEDILKKIEDKGNLQTEKLSTAILDVKEVVCNKIIDENRRLRTRVTFLETRLYDAEKQIHKNDNHSRKVNFEIEGIPQTIKQDKLRETAVKIFEHAGVENVSAADIEVIHRLKSKKIPQPTIVKAKQDFIDKVLDKKLVIRNVGKNFMGFGDENKLYINPNLSPEYKKLSYNCRLLSRAKLIEDTWFTNGAIKIKTLDEEVIVIGHEVDLVNIFPDFADFSFDTSMYKLMSYSNDSLDIERYGDSDGW